MHKNRIPTGTWVEGKLLYIFMYNVVLCTRVYEKANYYTNRVVGFNFTD